MFTVPERIERDGRLVARKGMTITMEEARALGLLPEEEKPKPKKSRKKKEEDAGTAEHDDQGSER